MTNLEIGVSQRQKAAAAPAFDPSIEYNPDSGFDNPGIWTQTRCTVSGSSLTATSNTSPIATTTAATTLAPGTYRCVYTLPVAFAVGRPGVFIGGATYNDSNNLIGVHTQDIVISTVSSQLIGFAFNSSNNGKSITDLSIKRIA